MFRKYIENTKKYSVVRQIFEFLLLSFIFQLIFVFTYLLFFNEIQLGIISFELSLPIYILSIAFLYPFLETLLCQYLLNLFLDGSKNKMIFLTFSTLVFSLIHLNKSVMHSFKMIPLGLFLALIFYNNSKNLKAAFFITFLLHSMHNIIGLIITDTTVGV